MNQKKLNQSWMKAAIIGSIWAAFEIIIGSFLHNLRFPFSGTLLSAASVFLIVGFQQIWKEKWLIFRAGIICALMKSISPSSVILGPMIGIMSEAILIELFTVLFGKNLFGFIIGGIMAVLSSLFQKVVNWLILYGFNIVAIGKELFHYFKKQSGLDISAKSLIYSVLAIYIVLGILAAISGYLAGRKYMKKRKKASGEIKQLREIENKFSIEDSIGNSHPWLNILLILSTMIGAMFALNVKILWVSFGLGLLFPVLILFFYKNTAKRLRKPGIWIQFFLLTLLASVFWEYFQSGYYFSMKGLIIGLQMNIRALIMIIGFAAISVELKNPLVKALLFKKGFANIYNAVNVSFSILPSIIEIFPAKKFSFKSTFNLVELMYLQAENLLISLSDKQVTEE